MRRADIDEADIESLREWAHEVGVPLRVFSDAAGECVFRVGAGDDAPRFDDIADVLAHLALRQQELVR